MWSSECCSTITWMRFGAEEILLSWWNTGWLSIKTQFQAWVYIQRATASWTIQWKEIINETWRICSSLMCSRTDSPWIFPFRFKNFISETLYKIKNNLYYLLTHNMTRRKFKWVTSRHTWRNNACTHIPAAFWQCIQAFWWKAGR